MQAILKTANRTAALPFVRRAGQVRARAFRFAAPLTLSLLGLSLLTGVPAPARADGGVVTSGAGPAVMNWGQKNFAMFTLGDSQGYHSGSGTDTAVTAWLGDQPDTADSSSENANWRGQAIYNFGFRIKDRPQVVAQPNKTLVFVNDNNQKIWCCSMKASSDGAQIQSTNDVITPITIAGGFDSYCIIPMPSKTHGAILSDPSISSELYPMLLVYVQNNTVYCERLDLSARGGNQWQLERRTVNAGRMFAVDAFEKNSALTWFHPATPTRQWTFPTT